MQRLLTAAMLALVVAAPVPIGTALAGPQEDFAEADAALEKGDDAAALSKYRVLAEQGHAPAQFMLGSMYSFGRGAPKSDAEALTWIRRAADQGFPEAQFALGIIYLEGLGVAENPAQAYAWLDLAANSAPQDDEVRSDATQVRDSLAAKMTPAQIAEAQQIARDFKPKPEGAKK
jgi:hypothetical protein